MSPRLLYVSKYCVRVTDITGIGISYSLFNVRKSDHNTARNILDTKIFTIFTL